MSQTTAVASLKKKKKQTQKQLLPWNVYQNLAIQQDFPRKAPTVQINYLTQAIYLYHNTLSSPFWDSSHILGQFYSVMYGHIGEESLIP